MSEEDELVIRARTRIGTVLNEKWRIDQLIGVGGMAVVYSATHRNKKRAAIKMLHPELSIDPSIRTRFLREGYAANSVEHPGVVRVDDDDVTQDGAAFLVMELLDGETVDARCCRKGGRLPAREVLSIADLLLDVLASAHAKGVVHRDLKPENVFLNRDGALKVLDFGIARLKELSTHASATRTGSLMGTPAFMAPEQARGRVDDIDGRTDLWAVGATMFYLLTGRFVHQAETPNEVLALAITQHAPPIASVDSQTPPQLAALVDRALAYHKQDRYPDARAMQTAVREAHAALQTTDDELAPRLVVSDSAAVAASVNGPALATASPMTTSTRTAPVGLGRRYLPVALGAGGLALAGLLVLLFVIIGQQRRPEPATHDSATASVPSSADALPPTPSPASVVAADGEPGTLSIDDLPVSSGERPPGASDGGVKRVVPAMALDAGTTDGKKTGSSDPFSKRK